jgi:hypothetical protein
MRQEKKILSSSRRAPKKADLWNDQETTQSNSLKEGHETIREYR